MKNNIKKICMLAVLTALYVVLSAFLKIPFIGNIQLDLGYIAFAVALYMFGMYGIFVGVIGCSLESLLFSAYGFSISWAIANLLIGLIVGIVFHALRGKEKQLLRIGSIIIGCVVGLLIAKTAIECYLYDIPLLVKIPKNAVACAVDAIVMIIGVYLAHILERRKAFTAGEG